jgi:hypothetical protein
VSKDDYHLRHFRSDQRSPRAKRLFFGEKIVIATNSQLYIDIACVYFYTCIMRSVSIILLVVLAFTVFAPMTSYTLIAVNDGRAFLGTLDVCHSAAPALSSNGEMPCVPIAVHCAIPSLSMMNLEPGNPLFTELILTTCNEHPPRS